MSPSTCPEIPELQALLADGDNGADDLLRHLDTCVKCQQALETLAGDSAAWEEAATGLVKVVWNEAALEHVVAQLKTEELVAEDEDLSFLRPADKPGLVGLFGSYAVLGEIGRGAMGIVLKALDPTLNRVVALKVLSPRLATSATARRRFLREGRAAAAVCHDSIVTVHGVSETDGLPYLVMQHIIGESLQDRLDRASPLEWEEIVQIGLQTATGLAAAHAQGLIHRDIKPANLLLELLQPPTPVARGQRGQTTRVKIADFGLARLADEAQLTQNGVLAGTPQYMAPEQARGEPVDHRADLFSLGSVLYASCTGVSPFRGSTAVAVLRQVSDGNPAPIRSLNPNVPAWLETLIAKLMAKAPADRFQSAAEVANLLEGFLAHLREPATTPAPELPPSQGDKEIRRQEDRGTKKRVYLLVCLTPCLLVCLLLAFWFTGGTGEPPAQRANAQDYHQSFKGDSAQPSGWELEGPAAESRVKFEPAGLRITLPTGWAGEGPATGVTAGFTVKGDFEITMGFEILNATASADVGDVSTRLSLVVIKDTRKENVATLSRSLTPKNGGAFVAWQSLWNDAAAKSDTLVSFIPSMATAGRLRLTRRGADVFFSVAEGTGVDFRVLTKFPFGDEDLKCVRITGSTGGAKAFLDARVTDLHIRALALPNVPASSRPEAPQEESPSPSPSAPWLAAGAVVGLVIVLALGGSVGPWLLLRRRQDKTPTAVAEEAMPAKAVALFFACSACGQKLKVKPESAGKKVKCPHCGNAMTVPQSTRSAKTAFIIVATGLLAVFFGYWIIRYGTSPATSFLDMPLGNQSVPGIADSGFHHNENDGEGPFRWTDGKGKLVIPLAKNDRPQALLVQLDRLENGALQIIVNNREVLKEEPSPNRVMGWEKTIDLSGVQLGKEVIVEIASNTRLDQGNDARREIGVSVRGITLLSRRGDDKMEEKMRPSSFLNVTLGNHIVPRIEELGFHPAERGNHGRFRWTKGTARLVIPLHKNERPQAILVQLGLPNTRSVRITVNDHELLDEKADEQGPVVMWLWEKTLDVSGLDLGDKVNLEIVSNTQPLLVDPRGDKTDARELGVAVRGIKLLGANR